MDNFAQAVEQERERLQTRLGELAIDRAHITVQMQEIEKQLKALQAYEDVKAAKPKTTKRATGRRDQLLTMLTVPMTRGDILSKLNVKGDKSSEQSVSNALSALKRQGKLTLDSEGRYAIP